MFKTIIKAIGKQLYIWLLCVLAIIVSMVLSDMHDYEMNATLKVINNICYGYIAGFVFYLPSVFFPAIRMEVNTLKLLQEHIKDLTTAINNIETKLFNGKEVSDDVIKNAIIVCFSLMDGPCCRDLEAMKRDVPIKQEFKSMFSSCNIHMCKVVSDINALQIHKKEYQCLLEKIKHCINKYEKVILPGIMHGEFDKNIGEFYSSFCDVQSCIKIKEL